MSQITKGKVLDAAELCYDSDTGKLSYLARSGADSSPAPRLAGGGVGLELGHHEGSSRARSCQDLIRPPQYSSAYASTPETRMTSRPWKCETSPKE